MIFCGERDIPRYFNYIFKKLFLATIYYSGTLTYLELILQKENYCQLSCVCYSIIA